ncbi:hypothetical protein MTO96_021254 [Rhipicephalus appendiculatus]
MSWGSASPHHRPVGRRLGVLRAAAQMDESQERSKRQCDQPRASVLGLITHSPVQSHLRLPRQRKPSPSANPQRDDEAQRATAIQFATFIEYIGSYSDYWLQRSTVPSYWVQWQFPGQQEQSVTTRQQHFKARNITLDAPEPPSQGPEHYSAYNALCAGPGPRRLSPTNGLLRASGSPDAEKDATGCHPRSLAHGRRSFSANAQKLR